jgi:hypothetical protein
MRSIGKTWKKVEEGEKAASGQRGEVGLSVGAVQMHGGDKSG